MKFYLGPLVPSTMDESSQVQNRRERRSNVLLTAVIELSGRTLDVKLRNLSADLGANLVGTQGIGQDSRGELYLANHSGAVYRIDPE